MWIQRVNFFNCHAQKNQCAESYFFLVSVFGFDTFLHRFDTMVASAVFITDLQGKAIISRNYRGDVNLNKAIERFANYLTDVEDEAKKPVFYVDTNGDVLSGEDVGATGTGGEHYVYVSVSTICTRSPILNLEPKVFRCRNNQDTRLSAVIVFNLKHALTLMKPKDNVANLVFFPAFCDMVTDPSPLIKL